MHRHWHWHRHQPRAGGARCPVLSGKLWLFLQRPAIPWDKTGFAHCHGTEEQHPAGVSLCQQIPRGTGSTDAPTLFAEVSLGPGADPPVPAAPHATRAHGRAWEVCGADLVPSASSSSSSCAPSQPWLCSLLERGREKRPQPWALQPCAHSPAPRQGAPSPSTLTLLCRTLFQDYSVCFNTQMQIQGVFQAGRAPRGCKPLCLHSLSEASRPGRRHAATGLETAWQEPIGQRAHPKPLGSLLWGSLQQNVFSASRSLSHLTIFKTPRGVTCSSPLGRQSHFCSLRSLTAASLASPVRWKTTFHACTCPVMGTELTLEVPTPGCWMLRLTGAG